MGGKHLKRLRNEKSKVKLKKKVLPKGQNITDTNFKIRQIHLQKQLKTVDQGEVVSSRNLSLKDLFVNLHHYNVSSRGSAINGIKEIVKKHKDVLAGSALKEIIYNVLEAVVDEEAEIRKSAMNLLNEVFMMLRLEQKLPYTDIMSVHLSCAMTHINVRIQGDSLTLLDIALTHMPQVVQDNAAIVMRNYMRLLTNYKFGFHLEGLLTSGQKKDIKKRKLEILNKLFEMLRTIFVPVDDLTVEKSLKVMYANQKHFSLQTMCNKHKDIANLVSVVRNVCGEQNDAGNKDNESRMYISLVMPYLIDTWTEFTPKKRQDSGNGCSIGLFTAKILEAILKSVQLLYKLQQDCDRNNGGCKEREWFISTYGKMFYRHFIAHFPYLPLDSETSTSVKLEGSTSPFIFTSLNLTLAFFFYSFHLNQSDEVEEKVEQAVLDILQDYKGLVQPTQNVCQVLELLMTSPALIKNKRRTDRLLAATVRAHEKSVCVKLKRGLSNVLSTIAESDSLDGLHDNQHMKRWMASLPCLLTKAFVSQKTISVISNLLQKRRQALCIALNQVAEAVLGNLPNITVKGVSMLKGHQMVANLLFYCNTDIVVSLLQVVSNDNSYPEHLKCYLIKVLTWSNQYCTTYS